MITILFFVVGLFVVVALIAVAAGRRGPTMSHDGLDIERDLTGRAESSGGVLGVHTNHGTFPEV
ncbi:hypothetical protein OG948_30530 [Embleya sp. NBC_00888]|uniref:hypothetical protein n=1 Tax=Embleya sp. NBC_00888 TaxID=2975960 RepID=UPI003870D08D|nr:hypothetical protein OG948_30530 [Embleya sp. NBC_00888]